MSIKNVKIQNFTVFNDIEIDFASGINVIIGENGLGKTHLMKVMYATMSDLSAENNINNYFGVKNRADLAINKDEMVRIGVKANNVSDSGVLTFLHGEWGEPDEQGRQRLPKDIGCVISKPKEVTPSVFIPAKEMLSHSRGLTQMAKLYSKTMPFDKTLLDIIDVSLRWKVDNIPELGCNILPTIEKIIDGKVVVKNDTFYIKKENGKMIEFSTEAEGIKKIALIWQLIMNGSITKDSVLFWDEPEANINPLFYKDVTEILLELSRNGVQIFLATHNYNFAKYIEVLMKDSDDVSFHALYKTDDGVKCETENKFTLLSNNALREDNINLYDAEMKKEFEE